MLFCPDEKLLTDQSKPRLLIPLQDLPLAVGFELAFGVAVSLAKRHTAGAIVPDDDVMQATADACWDAIAR